MSGSVGRLDRLVPVGAGPLLFSAALVAIAFPPLHLVLPSLVGLAPLAVWIERTGGSGRGALGGGFFYGLALWLLLLRWGPTVLARHRPGALPAWLLAVLGLALLTAGVVWTAHRLRHRLGAPVWLALPLAWTAGEWARAHLPGSLAFPWLDLGTSLSGYPELVGAAEWVGSRGVGFVLVTANALIGWTWTAAGPVAGRPAPPGGIAGAGVGGPDAPSRRFDPRRAATGVAATALLLGVPALWGLHRAATLETRPALTVAVLQSAVELGPGTEPEARAEAGVAALERLLPLAVRSERSRPDVAVFPEGLLPVALQGADAVRLRERLESAVRRAGVPVLVGAVGRSGELRYNSAFLVHPDGGLGRRVDKRHLIPVVERLPLPAWLPGGDAPKWGGYAFGADPDPVRVDEALLGVLICWESSFARMARKLRRDGAEVLVNVTNDAWFNAASPWGRTSALRQHPAHLTMRAVETRAGVARAANTGLSLFVDPVGRVHQTVPAFREGVEIRAVHTTDGRTGYVRWGDVAGRGCATVVAGLLLLSVFARPGERAA